MRHNNGASTAPCSTPEITGKAGESKWLTDTGNDFGESNECSLLRWGSMLSLLNFHRRRRQWHTVSKAFWSSKKLQFVKETLSRMENKSLVSMRSCVSHEKKLSVTVLMFAKEFTWYSKFYQIWEQIICSNILQGILVSVMVLQLSGEAAALPCSGLLPWLMSVFQMWTLAWTRSCRGP